MLLGARVSDQAPNLPRQLIPNLVGSSEVNIITSNDLLGLKPDLRNLDFKSANKRQNSAVKQSSSRMQSVSIVELSEFHDSANTLF